MSKSDSIFNIGLLALAAYVLYSMGLFDKPKETKETTNTTAAEKAIAASEASSDPILKKVYDQKYLKSSCSWYDRILDPIGCAVKDTTGAPELSPAPKPTPKPPELCPWNDTILAGDVRCQNPSQSTVIIGKPEPGFTECIIGAPKSDGGC